MSESIEAFQNYQPDEFNLTVISGEVLHEVFDGVDGVPTFRETLQTGFPHLEIVAPPKGVIAQTALAASGAVESEYEVERLPEPNGVVSELDREAPAGDSIRAYLNQIGKIALLTAEEEVMLAKRIEAGVYAAKKLEVGGVINGQLRRDLNTVARQGQAAKNTMLEANLRLAVNLAKRYTGRGLPLLDLIQEANLGLIRAIEKFDYTKGYKFSTYATWWVRQTLSRSLADTSTTIRIPVHTTELLNKMGKVRRLAQQADGRDLSDGELAVEMDLTPKKLADLQDHDRIRHMASLDMPVGKDDGEELGNLLTSKTIEGPEVTVAATMLEEDVAKLLATLYERKILTEQQVGVLVLRYGLDGEGQRTLNTIGAQFGVSQARIRQVEAKAIKTILRVRGVEELRAYL